MDALARNGALFTQAIANGYDTPSAMGPIFTSRYASFHHPVGMGLVLAPQWPTITEILHKSGYDTAAFNAANAWLTADFQFDRGFNVFVDHMTRHNRIFTPLIRYAYQLRGEKLGRAEQLTSHALSWLTTTWQKTHKPFFLWFHYMDTHFPYNPKNLSWTQRINAIRLNHKMIQRNGAQTLQSGKDITLHEAKKIHALYEQEIAYVDQSLGQFLEQLADIEVSPENTYLILTADHGEQFMEHGGMSHGEFYEENIRIPLILHGPDIRPRVIPTQVNQLDIAPTILELLNIDAEKSFLGQSVVPLLQGNEGYHEGIVISECPIERAYCCRTPYSKLISRDPTHIQSYLPQKTEFYNLKNDPEEQTNLYNDTKPEVQKLKSILHRHQQWVKRIIANNHVDRRENLQQTPRDAIQDRLRYLGYR
jgi:arylsulfatase